LTRAFAIAVAGDDVQVAGGTHVGTCTANRSTPAFRPASSGTAARPIRFFTTGTATLRCASGTGPILGTVGNSYIVLDGFTADENLTESVSDTGPVTIWGSRFITLQNSTVRGKTISRMDNHTGIRLEGAQDIYILGNTITGVRETGGAGQNTACIMGYDSVRVTIEGNTIGGTAAADLCDVGIFPKGFHGGSSPGLDAWTIRRNRIQGRYAGLHIGGLGSLTPFGSTAFARSVISDNVITSSIPGNDGGGWGILLRSYDAISPRAITFANNTIVATNAAIIATSGPNPAGAGQTDLEFRDNILQGGVIALNFHWTGARPNVTSRNNLLWAPAIGATGFMYTDGAPRASLSQWRSLMGLDGNSLNFDPRLTTDYKLPAGSQALTGSSTGGAIGAR
jgi:hypothetical protein